MRVLLKTTWNFLLTMSGNIINLPHATTFCMFHLLITVDAHSGMRHSNNWKWWFHRLALIIHVRPLQHVTRNFYVHRLEWKRRVSVVSSFCSGVSETFNENQLKTWRRLAETFPQFSSPCFFYLFYRRPNMFHVSFVVRSKVFPSV